jgi:hypothetical protein
MTGVHLAQVGTLAARWVKRWAVANANYEMARGGSGIAVTFNCDYHLNVHGLPRHSAAAVAAHVEAISRFQ